jgi:sarcosine oxidase subunit delta
MMIHCPHCGSRDSGEFFIRGEAMQARPDYAQGQAAFADYVYGRANIAGVQKEHWYHAAGCRNWLVVERDTLSHRLLSVAYAREERA